MGTIILMTEKSHIFKIINLKLLNIPLASKAVQQVITDFNSSKSSGSVYISVVVLKNFEPEF